MQFIVEERKKVIALIVYMKGTPKRIIIMYIIEAHNAPHPYGNRSTHIENILLPMWFVTKRCFSLTMCYFILLNFKF